MGTSQEEPRRHSDGTVSGSKHSIARWKRHSINTCQAVEEEESTRPIISRPICNLHSIQMPGDGRYIDLDPSRPRINIDIPTTNFDTLFNMDEDTVEISEMLKEEPQTPAKTLHELSWRGRVPQKKLKTPSNKSISLFEPGAPKPDSDGAKRRVTFPADHGLFTSSHARHVLDRQHPVVVVDDEVRNLSTLRRLFGRRSTMEHRYSQSVYSVTEDGRSAAPISNGIDETVDRPLSDLLPSYSFPPNPAIQRSSSGLPSTGPQPEHVIYRLPSGYFPSDNLPTPTKPRYTLQSLPSSENDPWLAPNKKSHKSLRSFIHGVSKSISAAQFNFSKPFGKDRGGGGKSQGGYSVPKLPPQRRASTGADFFQQQSYNTTRKTSFFGIIPTTAKKTKTKAKKSEYTVLRSQTPSTQPGSFSERSTVRASMIPKHYIALVKNLNEHRYLEGLGPVIVVPELCGLVEEYIVEVDADGDGDGDAAAAAAARDNAVLARAVVLVDEFLAAKKVEDMKEKVAFAEYAGQVAAYAGVCNEVPGIMNELSRMTCSPKGISDSVPQLAPPPATPTSSPRKPASNNTTLLSTLKSRYKALQNYFHPPVPLTPNWTRSPHAKHFLVSSPGTPDPVFANLLPQLRRAYMASSAAWSRIAKTPEQPYGVGAAVSYMSANRERVFPRGRNGKTKGDSGKEKVVIEGNSFNDVFAEDAGFVGLGLAGSGMWCLVVVGRSEGRGGKRDEEVFGATVVGADDDGKENGEEDNHYNGNTSKHGNHEEDSGHDNAQHRTEAHNPNISASKEKSYHYNGNGTGTDNRHSAAVSSLHTDDEQTVYTTAPTHTHNDGSISPLSSNSFTTVPGPPTATLKKTPHHEDLYAFAAAKSGARSPTPAHLDAGAGVVGANAGISDPDYEDAKASFESSFLDGEEDFVEVSRRRDGFGGVAGGVLVSSSDQEGGGEGEDTVAASGGENGENGSVSAGVRGSSGAVAARQRPMSWQTYYSDSTVL